MLFLFFHVIVLFQQPTLSYMTPFELTFSYKIESMMSAIDHPEYRQILVEVWDFFLSLIKLYGFDL